MIETQLPQVPTNSPSKILDQNPSWTPKQVDLLRKTICPGATDDQLLLFMHVCNRSHLDPFSRQIYAVQRRDNKNNENKMVIQVSIDGFRLIAARTGEYEGQVGPFWCGTDGKWAEVWISDDKPYAAKVGVLRKGFREPLWGVAKFDQYCQTYKDKSGQERLAGLWDKMADTMIAKCAESLALRKAFPAELSGLYTGDEMGETARNDHPPAQDVQKESQDVQPSTIGTLPPPSGLSNLKCENPVSDKQAARLFSIARKAGWQSTQIASFMKGYLGIQQSKYLHWKDYDNVCHALTFPPAVILGMLGIQDPTAHLKEAAKEEIIDDWETDVPQ